jgi:hypothetical protein
MKRFSDIITSAGFRWFMQFEKIFFCPGFVRVLTGGLSGVWTGVWTGGWTGGCPGVGPVDAPRRVPTLRSLVTMIGIGDNDHHW